MNQEAHFEPQLTQQQLAEMIDREGLRYQTTCYGGDKNWQTMGGKEKALPLVKDGHPIRLAPGALTEFGLKPGMVPHNPAGLPADVITEGGKYRAWSQMEFLNASPGDKGVVKGMQQWNGKSWTKPRYCGYEGSGYDSTYRVPINTPFPKATDTCAVCKMPLHPVIGSHCHFENCPHERPNTEELLTDHKSVDSPAIPNNPSRVDPESSPERSEAAYRAFHKRKDSETPRTDEELRVKKAKIRYGNIWVEDKFARQLERELNAALAENAKLKARIADLGKGGDQ